MKAPGQRFEQRITKEEIRAWLEDGTNLSIPRLDMFFDENCQFYINPVEGGTQRDPTLEGFVAVWWTPSADRYVAEDE